MKHKKYLSDDEIIDIKTTLSLRLDTNQAMLEMIEKIINKSYIELEYATYSSPYLEKLFFLLIKINDFKTSKIIKKNNKLLQVKDIDVLKDIKKIFLDKSSTTMKLSISDRLQKLLSFDEILKDYGENVEISKYVLHVCKNIKSCIESEMALDNFYKDYLKKEYEIEIDTIDELSKYSEVDNER